MSSMAKQRSDSSVGLLASMFQRGLYKPTQGRIVRQVTFVAFGVLALLIAWEIGNIGFVAEMFLDDAGRITEVSNYVCLLVFGGIGLWVGYRIVNYPVFADFLIAVEAEMNKVSWPTWPELWKASLVVIFVIFSMALALWVFDLIWTILFQQIGIRAKM